MTEALSSISSPSTVSRDDSTQLPVSRRESLDTIESLSNTPPEKNLFLKKFSSYARSCFTYFISFLCKLLLPFIKLFNIFQPKIKEPEPAKDILSPIEKPHAEIPKPLPSSFLLELTQQPRENVIHFFIQEFTNHCGDESMKTKILKEFFDNYLAQLDDQEHYSILLQLIPPRYSSFKQ